MTHLGITDTIAQTEADYVEIAIRLAQDRSQREVLATRIRGALPGNDVAMTAYTRSLEAALHEAWRLRQPCQDEGPSKSRLSPVMRRRGDPQ